MVRFLMLCGLFIVVFLFILKATGLEEGWAERRDEQRCKNMLEYVEGVNACLDTPNCELEPWQLQRYTRYQHDLREQCEFPRTTPPNQPVVPQDDGIPWR